ncbi:MAG: GNAT family N-acetyltransferase [Spirochaetaceae bacterium]|nr:MAG: GNAT family N-acetyltransferase [Spirochaetaceae bacterium]
MIVTLNESRVAVTENLVRRVFPWQNPLERMFYWAWRRRGQSSVRLLLRLVGISAIDDTWIYLNDAGKVCGTIGLYARTEDAAEARWVSWFCVDPETRGQGIGKSLLDHLIEVVRSRGYRYLRLYTGSDPDEAAAQLLYESRGLRETRRKPFLFVPYDKIWRELELDAEVVSERTDGESKQGLNP